MGFPVLSRIKAYTRQKLLKTEKQSARTDPSTHVNKTEGKSQHLTAPMKPDKKIEPRESLAVIRFSEQEDSQFFRKLPQELRMMVYAHVWQGPYDHMYHESSGRHLHFKNGRWVHTRCVMYKEDDENPDLIQTQMDRISCTGGSGDLLLWQRRLASTWGQRHWRCGERIEHGEPTSIDHTDLGALMVVCKKMHPEVMESFLGSHTMIFNDIFSAYRFLVRSPSTQLLQYTRKLDLTLSVPFHWLAPFFVRSGTGDPAVTAESSVPLGAILAAVAEKTTCLHSLRISLDVYDRGPWREIPERSLVPALKRISVRRGQKGEVNYIVELPPTLPVRVHDSLDEPRTSEEGTEAIPFRVVRRPPLRYWQFNPREVEHFTWGTCKVAKPHHHCCIALAKTTRYIANLYPIDFSGE
ncbi:hypothetical protein GGS21DRAFT_547604 [Xylaria nigripes]|nr:hypothetical protein GGS21DRAFT_547604 [Xylaria nigripes]